MSYSMLQMDTSWAGSDEENQWRRTFCQVPFSAIYEHADKGKRSLKELVAFIRCTAQAERGASEQLRELAFSEIGKLEEPGTGIRRALFELKDFIDASSQQQLIMAQVLDEQVAEPLESLKDASETYIQTLKGVILNANNEYEKAAAAHCREDNRLKRATMELRESRDRQRLALHEIGVPVFELQRLATRVSKCEEEQAQAVMARARAKTTLYNQIIARDEMTMAVSVAYQKAEEERLDQLSTSLHRFVHVEKERLQRSQQMLTTLETHVQSLSRAEDIQLLIHNQRDPDNLHFQGKALALLDWQWNKAQGNRLLKSREQSLGLSECRRSIENGLITSPASRADSDTISFSVSHDVVDNNAEQTIGSLDSPQTVLKQTPMSTALHQCFYEDVESYAPVSDESDDLLKELPRDLFSVDSCGSSSTKAPTISSIDGLVRETCTTAEGRALFVKCLNRQRSLETQVKDHASFEILVTCFNAFLDECVREDDVKAAKTAMILAETFYMPKIKPRQAQSNEDEQDPDGSPRHERSQTQMDDADVLAWRRPYLCADSKSLSSNNCKELLQHVDHTHPLLHGGGIGRGATRTYLQMEVKNHIIWKSPSVSMAYFVNDIFQSSHNNYACIMCCLKFWEKALLIAIGEELHRTPQPCPWEELSSETAKHNGLSSRKEAVCRVHNIVFGQLGSYTLSMLEFDVPLPQIESFVETMCDAHELTEDQRFLLRKNLREIYATLQ